MNKLDYEGLKEYAEYLKSKISKLSMPQDRDYIYELEKTLFAIRLELFQHRSVGLIFN